MDKEWSVSNPVIEGVLVGLVADFIGWILPFLLGLAYFYFKKKKVYMMLGFGVLEKSIFLWALSFSTLFLLFRLEIINDGIQLLLISCMFSFILIIYAVKKFFQLGLKDTFSKTIDGVGYDRSLKLASQSFAFLGIGGHKLTSLPEFEKMISRCSEFGSNRPVRFLLSSPTNPILQKVAQRSNIDPKEYGRRVLGSVKKIASLVDAKGFNVEVRFYQAEDIVDYKQLRLVFIDDKVCIASFTVWDSTEGHNNPQLILENSKNKTGVPSLYESYKDYFERLWDDPKNTKVDLNNYPS